MEQYSIMLKDLVSTFKIELFIETTISHLQHEILHSMLQDELSANFTFEIKEVKLAGSLGRSILNTCFYSFSNTNVLFSPNTETKLEGLESLFALLFSYYQEKIDLNKGIIGILSPEQWGSISTLLREVFNLETHNPLFLEFVCKTIISKTLKNALNEPNSIQFISIMDSLTELGLDTQQIYVTQQLFQQSIMDTSILLGSLVINYLVEYDLFQSISKIENSKTINYLSLNHQLTYSFLLTSTTFRPYFHTCNIKNTNSLDLEFIKDNVNITFKLNNILDKFHFNKTGTGFFNSESIFSREPSIGNLKVSVYKSFLDDYISLLEKIQGKTYDALMQEKLMGYLACYLSLFDINFDILLNDTKNMPFIKSLIEYAVDFDIDDPQKISSILDTQDYADVQRKQFLTFFHKIRSYKGILKLCLSDYVVYSNVNFVIIPSFYDLTGRRYPVGISFNPQTYQFVKGFIKLSEPHISQISEKDFTHIVSAECSQINNLKIREQLTNLMSNYSVYQQQLLVNIQEFLYSFMNPSKITKEEFNLLLSDATITFLDLYATVVNNIDKKSKALTICSYIMLERYTRMSYINYANFYSYDMVTSGYHMLAMEFKNRKTAIASNLIGTEKNDLYLIMSSSQEKAFTKSIKVLSSFLKLAYNVDILGLADSRNHILIHLYNIFEHFKEDIFEKHSEYPKEFYLIRQDKYLFEYILNLNSYIEPYSWMLSKRDFKYLNNYDDFTPAIKLFITNILILGRIYALHFILQDNLWLTQHNIIGDRKSRKKETMIDIYGGKRGGRAKAFKNYITTSPAEYGVTPLESCNHLFHYFENYFLYAKDQYVTGMSDLMQLSRILAEKEQIITVKNKHFTFLLAPVKLKDSKRLKIDTRKLDLHRRPYQTNIHRIDFYKTSKVTKNLDSKGFHDLGLKIDKRKQATLFPPNFIHAKDANIVHLFMEKTFLVNKYLSQVTPHIQFNSCTTHDNFSKGRLLFSTIPYVVRDCYFETFENNFLVTLKDNFTLEELDHLEKRFISLDSFTSEEMFNTHMMKYG